MLKKNLVLACIMLCTATLFARPALLGKTSYKANSIVNLDINLSSEDLEFVCASGSEITVEIYCNKKKYAPAVKVSSSTLEIKYQKTFFSFGRRDCSVVVSIPEGKNFEKARLLVSSGDILIEEISAASLTARSSSGDITIKSGYSPKLTMSASSGDLLCSGFSSGESTFNTSSGKIRLEELDTKALFCAASSGSITAKDLDCQNFTVTTSSGTIGLELYSTPVKKSYASTSSGTLYISLPNNSSVDIAATTSSGSFTNSFTKERLDSHANYSSSINGGGARIKLSSSSGSITVDNNSYISYTRYNPDEDNDEDIPVVIFDEK